MEGLGLLDELVAGFDCPSEFGAFKYEEADQASNRENGYELVFYAGIACGQHQLLVDQLRQVAKMDFIKKDTRGETSRYYCHLSGRGKLASSQSSKKCNCPASLSIKTLSSKKAAACKGWPGGLQSQVTLNAFHNHQLLGNLAKKQLKPGDQIRDQFMDLFSAGKTAAEALSFFREELKEDPAYTDAWLSDGTMVPKVTSVEYWYRWYRDNAWGRTPAEKLSNLKDRALLYQTAGTIVEVSAGLPAAVAILTPLMQRCQKEWHQARSSSWTPPPPAMEMGATSP
jgi:hypothetical protein